MQINSVNPVPAIVSVNRRNRDQYATQKSMDRRLERLAIVSYKRQKQTERLIDLEA